MNRLRQLVICFIVLLFLPDISFGQSAHYAPHSRAAEYMQELDIQDTSETNFHAAIRNYYRKDIQLFEKSFHSSSPRIQYLAKDNVLYTKYDSLAIQKKGYLKGLLYKTEANLFQLEKKYLKLYINPILNIQFGSEKQRETLRFHNMRGIEMYGLIDERIYIYTNVLETQGNFHNYMEDRIRRFRSIPGFSFYKPFRSSVNENLFGHDYANAKGYLGIPISKHIGIELGHGNHFIGHGYHSLIMEDYANNYFYLKLNTRIWKLHYQNIFAELSPISTRLNPEDSLLPKKYMAAHYLSFKPHKNVEIGLFESVIFARPDKFEFHYLNPIILYRTVEYYLDSPDNVMIGLNGKWNLWNKFSLYGQLLIDDLKISEIRKDDGWWGQKYGVQAGVNYPDVAGIPNLDFKAEYNMVRPYTYSHRDTLPGFEDYSIANYSNYNQPMAHPLGANFWEALAIIQYQPIDELFIQAQYSFAKQGRSEGAGNFGENILLPDESRPSDYGIEFLQGESTDISSFKLDISYSFYHNYYIDFHYLNRLESNEDALYTDYYGIGIRANINRVRLDY